jgi:hypothetical protein
MLQVKAVAVDEIVQRNLGDDIDDDDDDNENAVSLNKIKTELSQPAFVNDIDKMSHAGERNLSAVVHINLVLSEI